MGKYISRFPKRTVLVTYIGDGPLSTILCLIDIMLIVLIYVLHVEKLI